jgi:transcription elongation factor
MRVEALHHRSRDHEQNAAMAGRTSTAKPAKAAGGVSSHLAAATAATSSGLVHRRRSPPPAWPSGSSSFAVNGGDSMRYLPRPCRSERGAFDQFL